jgi:legumain
MKGIGSGKVIKSGPDDNVFVYYADHGAPGFVCMPTGDYLYADKLIALVKQMHTEKKYKNLVFYIEACESGSMFDKILPTDINVYATTAANPTESSYAFYYDQKIGTYLGDEYSVRWLEDSDAEPLKTYTLDQQFETVKKIVNESHPQKYGEASMGSLDTGAFQTFGNKAIAPEFSQGGLITLAGDKVDSRDVKLVSLLRQYHTADENKKAMIKLLIEDETRIRAIADTIAYTIIDELISRDSSRLSRNELALATHSPTNFDCLRFLVQSVEKECGKLNDYSLKHVRKLVNICESGYDLNQVYDSIAEACSFIKF